MKRQRNRFAVTWEHTPALAAEARIDAAFDLLFKQALAVDNCARRNLTENSGGGIMPHGSRQEGSGLSDHLSHQVPQEL